MISKKETLRRSIDFPVDVYEKLKEVAFLNETSINAIVIRSIRNDLNFHKELKKDKEIKSE